MVVAVGELDEPTQRVEAGDVVLAAEQAPPRTASTTP